MSTNLQDNRTKKINGVISIDGVPWLFVQGLTAIFDSNVFTRDIIEHGS
jgi:hypothetical protein